MYGTDVIVRKTFDVGFLADNQPDDSRTTPSLLGRIADNTEETVNILRTAVLGPSQQDLRDEGISKGDTDPPTKEGGRFGNALKGIGSALDKVNPFSSNFMFGNIGRALLAGGGLILLKLFGDNLIGPLASLLETIKTGKIGEKITDTYTAIKEKAIPIFEGIKDNTITFIENAKKVFGLIQGAYQAVEAYVMSFDVKGKMVQGPAGMMIEVGDGILDEQEMSNLKDDVQKRLTDAVVGFIGNLVGQLADGIKGIFLLPVTLGLVIGAIKNMVIGAPVKPPQGPTKTGAPVKAKGGMLRSVLGKAGLVAAITFGVFELIDKSKQAYADAITDEMGKKQNFDFSELIGNFFGGPGEGGIFNSFSQMFSMGTSGLAVGAGLGFTLAKLGFTFGTGFGPIGMATGALLGFVVGSLIGAVGGYFGGEKISKMLDDFGSMISDAGNAVFTYFSDLVESVKSFFTGSTTRKDADLDYLTSELTETQQEIEKVKKRNLNVPQNKSRLAFLENKEKELLDKIDRVEVAEQEYAAGVSLEQLSSGINEETTRLGILRSNKEAAKRELANMGLEPGDFEYDQAMSRHNDLIEEAKFNISQFRVQASQIIKGAGADVNKFQTPGSATGSQLSMGFAGTSAAVSNNIITAHKTNADNIAHSNYSLGGLTVGNQDLITEELIKGVR